MKATSMLTLRVVTVYLTLAATSSEAGSSGLLWASAFPNEIGQRSFETPDDLRSHLDTLSDYYAVAARPRFGKRYFGTDLTFLNNRQNNQIPRKYWNRILWALMHPSASQFSSESL